MAWRARDALVNLSARLGGCLSPSLEARAAPHTARSASPYWLLLRAVPSDDATCPSRARALSNAALHCTRSANALHRLCTQWPRTEPIAPAQRAERLNGVSSTSRSVAVAEVELIMCVHSTKGTAQGEFLPSRELRCQARPPAPEVGKCAPMAAAVVAVVAAVTAVPACSLSFALPAPNCSSHPALQFRPSTSISDFPPPIVCPAPSLPLLRRPHRNSTSYQPRHCYCCCRCCRYRCRRRRPRRIAQSQPLTAAPDR